MYHVLKEKKQVFGPQSFVEEIMFAVQSYLTVFSSLVHYFRYKKNLPNGKSYRNRYNVLDWGHFLHRLTSTCMLFSVQKNLPNGKGSRNRYNFFDSGHKKETVECF